MASNTQVDHDLAVSFRDGLSLRPNDVFIAVMGVTGAGKSTFISKCSNKVPAIGHNLQACTNTVEVYPCRLDSTTTVYLIDTPGFDDTNRSDNEVLSELASWLTASYSAQIRLSGIIYLHRISDIRMQGSAKKNLFMFKKLCGPQALKNVILATTMWDRISEAEGQARENELISTPDFWGWMLDQGSKIFRHTGDKVSAFVLIQALVKENTQVTLALQQQMGEENKSLDETDAGKELHAEIVKERKKFEQSLAQVKQQMDEALEAKDKESAKVLEDIQSDYKDRIQRLEQQGNNLKNDLEEIHQRKYRQMEQRLLEADRRFEKVTQQIEQERSRMEAELLQNKKTGQQQATAGKQREKHRSETTKQSVSTKHYRAKRPDLNIALPRASISGDSFFLQNHRNRRGTYVKNGGLPLSFPDCRFHSITWGQNRNSWVTQDIQGYITTCGTEYQYPGLESALVSLANPDTYIYDIALGWKDNFVVLSSRGNIAYLDDEVNQVISGMGFAIDDIKSCSFGLEEGIIITFSSRQARGKTGLLTNRVSLTNLTTLYPKADSKDSHIWRSYIFDQGTSLSNLHPHCYQGLEQTLRQKIDKGLSCLVASLSMSDDKFLIVLSDGHVFMRCHPSEHSLWEGWVRSLFEDDRHWRPKFRYFL